MKLIVKFLIILTVLYGVCYLFQNFYLSMFNTLVLNNEPTIKYVLVTTSFSMFYIVVLYFFVYFVGECTNIFYIEDEINN